MRGKSGFGADELAEPSGLIGWSCAADLGCSLLFLFLPLFFLRFFDTPFAIVDEALGVGWLKLLEELLGGV